MLSLDERAIQIVKARGKVSTIAVADALGIERRSASTYRLWKRISLNPNIRILHKNKSLVLEYRERYVGTVATAREYTPISEIKDLYNAPSWEHSMLRRGCTDHEKIPSSVNGVRLMMKG